MRIFNAFIRDWKIAHNVDTLSMCKNIKNIQNKVHIVDKVNFYLDSISLNL